MKHFGPSSTCLLRRAVEIVQRERDALVDCHTMPIGDLSTLDPEARDAYDEFEEFLGKAKSELERRA